MTREAREKMFHVLMNEGLLKVSPEDMVGREKAAVYVRFDEEKFTSMVDKASLAEQLTKELQSKEGSGGSDVE